MNKIDIIMMIDDTLNELEHLMICSGEIMDNLESVRQWIIVVDQKSDLTMIAEEMQKIRKHQEEVDRR